MSERSRRPRWRRPERRGDLPPAPWERELGDEAPKVQPRRRGARTPVLEETPRPGLDPLVTPW